MAMCVLLFRHFLCLLNGSLSHDFHLLTNVRSNSLQLSFNICAAHMMSEALFFSLSVCVCALALASLSLLGPTCVPDVPYQVLSPHWDLIWDPIGVFIDSNSLTLIMPPYHCIPHRANYYRYRILTHPSTHWTIKTSHFIFDYNFG